MNSFALGHKTKHADFYNFPEKLEHTMEIWHKDNFKFADALKACFPAIIKRLHAYLINSILKS